MKRAFEQKLPLGETTVLKGNVFEKRVKVVYTGQLDTERYSIAVILTHGYNSFAYNLYFDSLQKEIRMPYGILTVIEVDANSLYFAYRAS